MLFRRVQDLDRGEVNREDGTFPVTLFSDGEASDGHILNIAGGRLPKRMPLFIGHFADPEFQLGSLTSPTKEKRGGLNVTRHVAQIEQDGAGAAAERRADLLIMVEKGHARSMSGRWDAEQKDVVRRTELPESHPAHVSPDEKGRKRFGLYFKRWVAMEGSLVGLGADPAAQVGRELAADQAEWWGRLGGEMAARDGDAEALTPLFEDLALLYCDARSRGASFEDVMNALDGSPGTEDAGRMQRVRVGETSIWVPERVAGYIEALRTSDDGAADALDAPLAVLTSLCERLDASIGEFDRSRAQPEPPRAPATPLVSSAAMIAEIRKQLPEMVAKAVRTRLGRLD